MYQESVDILKDFYHEAHEDHEESNGYKNVFVLFVSFVVKIPLHLELLLIASDSENMLAIILQLVNRVIDIIQRLVAHIFL